MKLTLRAQSVQFQPGSWHNGRRSLNEDLSYRRECGISEKAIDLD